MRVLASQHSGQRESNVRALTWEQLVGLLSPWLGGGDILRDLPIPALIDVIKTQMSANDKGRFAARAQKVREQSSKLLEQWRLEATYQWDAKPISSARLMMELWDQIKGEDWKNCKAGESFKVPGNSSFDIEVTGEPYHYVCHFG